jgi:hypothetical protein
MGISTKWSLHYRNKILIAIIIIIVFLYVTAAFLVAEGSFRWNIGGKITVPTAGEESLLLRGIPSNGEYCYRDKGQLLFNLYDNFATRTAGLPV